MTDLDLARIQGFVVRGYTLPIARYLFLRIDDAAGAAAWISTITEEVQTAATWSVKPESGVNLAFSYAGLAKLELPDACMAGFPEEFRQGMAARADLLGDTGESAPEHWEGGFGGDEIHVFVMISAKHEAALEAHDKRLRAGIAASGGLTVVYEDVGALLPTMREHFGYADGFAQPAIEGSGVPMLPGQGAVTKEGGWRPIRAGEFILGYPDEEGVLPDAPPAAELTTNASYLVYRKLYQDVAKFRGRLTESAKLYPGGEELLAAKVVGRWRDGTPLELSPEQPDPAIVADEQRNNSSRYADDPNGLKCPIGAHTRRVNPRDSLPFDGQLVNRHRLIRRGLPYGPPLAAGAEDDGRDRGVIFITLQASIARQFEFVQSQWLGAGNTFGLGEDQDVLLGPQDQEDPATVKKMIVPGDPPFFVGPLERVVTVRGGEYFFVPGINGLQFLAAAAGGGAA
ncbi:MAG TPA: Dyp-type peroxidase [Solirubrobacteraceae bacterium]|nr:Dyp-type peroxidase [Solirubrobacteraceae bacterium]